jgi:hypothetical protein
MLTAAMRQWRPAAADERQWNADGRFGNGGQ